MKNNLFLLALVTLALFSLGITDGHLQLDDWGYTAGCPFVASGLSPANITQAFRDFGHGGIWMPLTYITYMADFSFLGGGWTVHHAVNVALHVLNTILVYTFLLSLPSHLQPNNRSIDESTNRTIPLLLLTLLWSLHPQRAEAVVWIASRKEELWTAFALLASLAWLRFLSHRDIGTYLLTCAAFILACLSKPTAVCIPFILLTLEGLLAKKPLRFAPYLPMLPISAIVGLIAFHAQTHPTGSLPIDIFDTTLSWRLTNAVVALGLYFWHMIYPLGIHIDYRAIPNAMPLDTPLGLTVLALVLAAFTLCLIRAHGTRRRLLMASAALFLIALLPVLGIVGFTGDKAYADRYTYLPTIFLLLPLLQPNNRSIEKSTNRKILFPFLLLFLLLSIPIIRSLHNDTTAYTRVLACDPEHWRALRIIGNIRCTQPDRMDEGVVLLRKSLRLRPSQRTANSLAYALALRGHAGDFEQVRALGRAIAANPTRDREGMMLEALGIVAMKTQNETEAIRYFRAALRAPERAHTSAHARRYLKEILESRRRQP